ncbi:hypothetical protein FCX44_07500 [Escherichia coli]|nr:hypothetical protein [Escherichia coli]
MPENPASYRVVRTKSYLFNKAHFIPTIQTGYPLYSLNATSICLRKIRGRTISSGRRGWQKKRGR